ncbi:uncharacterized protein [Leuresthes tenuis]|uniref:uncharacterized protein n=1 Tax=Leuresthes tenuis TaxID=355514 RepID=UPI003B50BD57
MSSVQYLKEFISERLTAAAAEIFGVFEKTIVQYEEEIDRQRRLLDITWKPQTKSQTADVPQQHVCQEEEAEEVVTDQLPCNQKRNSSLGKEEPEPPQIKEEQEELCTSQEGEPLVLKEESDTFMVTLTYEESEHSEPEPNNNDLQDQGQEVSEDLGSTSNADTKAKEMHQLISNSSSSEDVPCPVSMNQCDADRGKISLKCGVCGKVFKNKYHLKMHHRIHTGVKPYACNDCGKRFNDASTLKYHLRTHTGEKPYSCETCGKSFRCSYSVLVHMRTHTGEKPYLCNTCGKRFTNLSAFKWHTAIHTGEKRYSCKICGKSFTQSGNLTAHMGTHTGEKRYSCKICEKSFSRSSNLIVHMRTHTGEKPYPCNTCGERFKYASALKKHIRTHADDESFSCETCGRGPTSNDNSSVQGTPHTSKECCPETSAGKIIFVAKVEENM